MCACYPIIGEFGAVLLGSFRHAREGFPRVTLSSILSGRFPDPLPRSAGSGANLGDSDDRGRRGGRLRKKRAGDVSALQQD